VSIEVNGKPTAVVETVQVTSRDPLDVTLHGTDPENDPLTYSVLTTPAKGVFTGTAPNLTYTPNQGASGTDYIVFRVNDGHQNSGNAIFYLEINLPPFQQWQDAVFGDNAGNPAIAGESADPDHDGIVNLMEYALNLDPNTAFPGGGTPGHNGLPAIDLEGGGLALIYRRNLSATDLTYLIEESDDMGATDPWSPATVTETTLSDDGNTRVIRATIPTNSSPRKFLRLKVTK